MGELLRVEHLTKRFQVERGVLLSRLGGRVTAVDDVSFSIEEGGTLGLVGESGCGKSTTGRCVIRLVEPTSGGVFFEGEDVRRLRGKALKRFRRDAQIVFQDPYASLNPRMTIGETVSEPLVIHGIGTRLERRRRVQDLLETVGLNPEHLSRYPHEFSGGQRQRIGIARALALNPRFIVCDEPVSALDVSIQAQIVNLLEHLQSDLGLAYLFITHDLSVVRHVSQTVAVMYLGRIVETGAVKLLYEQPHHPYTQSLLSAAPVPDPARRRRSERIVLEGDTADPTDLPSGCRFRTRCPVARPACSEEEPPLREVGPAHSAACHYARAFPVDVDATEETA